MELDIVMDADTPLWKSHDISEELQEKIEALPGVERAFVHVDHETRHTPVRTPPSRCSPCTASADTKPSRRNIASVIEYALVMYKRGVGVR